VGPQQLRKYVADVVRVTREKVVRYGLTYFWIGALLALPALPGLFRDRKMRLLLITFMLVSAGAVVVIWSNAHYAAPLTCIVVALIVQAVRYLRTVRIRAWPVGTALARAIVLLLVLDTSINAARGICDPLIWPCEGDPSRTAVISKLEHTPGKHLVMVRYEEENHNIHDEWSTTARTSMARKFSGPVSSMQYKMRSSSPTSKIEKSGW